MFEIGETPLPAAAKSTKQIENKMDRLTKAMKGLIFKDSPNTSPKTSDENEITTNRSDQIQILTNLPKS